MDFTVGDTKVVSGKVTAGKYTSRLVMTSPDVVAPLTDLSKVSLGFAFFTRILEVYDRRDSFGDSYPREDEAKCRSLPQFLLVQHACSR